MVESLAITGHLDEAFPGPSLQPQGHAERARMRTWMGLCGDYVFRDVVRPVYDDLMAGQIVEATEKRGAGDLAALLHSGETWTIS